MNPINIALDGLLDRGALRPLEGHPGYQKEIDALYRYLEGERG